MKYLKRKPHSDWFSVVFGIIGKFGKTAEDDERQRRQLSKTKSAREYVK